MLSNSDIPVSEIVTPPVIAGANRKDPAPAGENPLHQWARAVLVIELVQRNHDIDRFNRVRHNLSGDGSLSLCFRSGQRGRGLFKYLLAWRTVREKCSQFRPKLRISHEDAVFH